MKIKISVKDCVKLGFGIAFGVKLGEEAAYVFNKIVVNASEVFLKKRASEGDESAKAYCNKWGVEYDSSTAEEEVTETED